MPVIPKESVITAAITKDILKLIVFVFSRSVFFCPLFLTADLFSEPCF
jgi:hypothetical protein